MIANGGSEIYGSIWVGAKYEKSSSKFVAIGRGNQSVSFETKVSIWASDDSSEESDNVSVNPEHKGEYCSISAPHYDYKFKTRDCNKDAAVLCGYPNLYTNSMLGG